MENQEKQIWKRWWFWLILIFAIILIIVIVLGSGNEPISSINQDENSSTSSTNQQEVLKNIDLTLDAKIDNDILEVFGTANLPNKALISYEISHELSPANFFKEGTAEVQNGKYEFSIDVKEWPSGNIKIWTAFQTMLDVDKQPQEIIDLYGEKGEKIPDPSAVELESLKRVEKTLTIVKP
ncbi:MAG TPA: hypothetical protein PLL80_00875 [Candidatus Pacearchaeota archaeon]|nr:hypothetical protein [Candidatus Pacearchaeota archaeon]HOK94080.1 hypothetical protein [Candidatus Pacearchaeota archaeon]HPO75151.1 hypothetical protein [Candidatus Pacearchaeota archaeon]